MERALKRGRLGMRLAFLCLALAISWRGNSQELTEEQFLESSLQFRTALHYDPLLDSPLDSLVKLYRSAEREDELIGLYRSHIEQYPDDAGAKTVLIRLLRRVDRGGADELIASAVPLHPEFAPLQYVFFKFLEERGDARAPEALSRAIDLETNPARRNDWLDQLLLLTESGEVRDLAKVQFDKLLAQEGQSSEDLMDLAGLMQRYQFWESSIAAINKARTLRLAPDAEIQADLMLSGALARLGNSADAGRMLETLLKKLAPDHWRRREIMSLRVSILGSDEERKELLANLEEAYRKNPASESVILDYAEALVACENSAGAVKCLVDAMLVLPNSQLVESRLLELFETSPDSLSYSQFLEKRLETLPDRIDLRFRLVKVNYALGKDSAAEQDFKVVVAGLPAEEVSDRILELQRYLRSIERIDAAAPYLERYVRNHPSRLDVARELAEVYLAVNSAEGVERMVRLINPAEADAANVLDLARFLIQEEFFNAARLVVTGKLSVESGHFELNLALIEILASMGDVASSNQQISVVREMTDTAERYRQWLNVSVEAHRKIESLSRFFDSEQNRFSFSDGKWTEDKVEKFLILCEVGKKQLFTDRVASGIREQLIQPGLDEKLRLRLRGFLVGVLENAPGSAAELEDQLKALAAEDPANRLDYELRRALVYHRNQRVDLAQDLMGGIDLTEIDSTSLLREASDALIDYGFIKEAEVATATINRLEPGDLLSWEKRLLLLVSLRQETIFRSVIRSLQNGEAGVRLREVSNRSLADHLNASYWRSISTLMASGETELENILPLLASLEREDLLPDSMLWADWTRALVLTRLGRSEDAAEAIARFRERASAGKIETVFFPDGLALSVNSASDFLAPRLSAGDEAGITFGFLLNDPLMKWAFELPQGATLIQSLRSGNRLVVFDDRSYIHVLDAESGKLLWRRFYGAAESGERLMPNAFRDFPRYGRFAPKPGGKILSGKAPPPFGVAGDRFCLILGNEIKAFSVLDGETLWTAPLPFSSSRKSSRSERGAHAETTFVIDGQKAVVFDPVSGGLCCFDVISGKLVWNLATSGDPSKAGGEVLSLNSGLTVNSGHVFAYGAESIIAEVESGKVVWRFGGEESAVFPIKIRKEREEDSDAGNDSPVKIPTGSVATDSGASSLNFSGISMYDFQSKASGGFLNPSEFLRGPATLLSPAVFWSESRIKSDEASFAVISEGYLLLMHQGKVRRISTRLPVASTELPADGTFLGQTGNHVWFLNGEFLLHLDFQSRRISQVTVRDLGDPATLRATLVGNQLLVRGLQGMKVVNAITGQIVGQTGFPPELVDYLRASGIHESSSKGVESVWQGLIRRTEDGAPPFVFSAGDLISDKQYITSFEGRTLVCLEAETLMAPPSTPLPGPPPVP